MRAGRERVTNPKEVLDLLASDWLAQLYEGDYSAVLLRDRQVPVARSANELLRRAGCLTMWSKPGDTVRASARGDVVREALDLYEACLFGKGCDDTAETQAGLAAAWAQGLIEPDGYALTDRGEALIAAVGAAKQRAAAAGPVVWPGPVVEVVQQFLQRQEVDAS